MKHSTNSKQWIISDSPSEEEMKIVQKGIEDHNKKFSSGGLDIPTPDISLVLKDSSGNIVGGVITSMLTGVMHLEVLWIDETYRGRGLGRDLVLQAERIGKKKGYSASQTWTFSFQAPEFYQSIGYKVVGIFDGYTNGITEYILLKKFESDEQNPYEVNELNPVDFTILEDKSETSMKILHEGLRNYVAEHVGELRKKNPGIHIKLVIKNEDDQVIGGVQAYTTLKAIHVVNLWVDEKFRNTGFGRELLTTAEKIAKENGCISGLLNVLSFQSPEFFQKQGYIIFGVSDGYSDSIKEYFLKKRF
ncbi:MAG: GNAT family N-acetyltransferase [Candidatus Heimdallarchaeota archaeon]|nr:MAG: GNAT family N-acetyltransferase [Candidatus Heimdallarchaeota archaeon]